MRIGCGKLCTKLHLRLTNCTRDSMNELTWNEMSELYYMFFCELTNSTPTHLNMWVCECIMSGRCIKNAVLLQTQSTTSPFLCGLLRGFWWYSLLLYSMHVTANGHETSIEHAHLCQCVEHPRGMRSPFKNIKNMKKSIQINMYVDTLGLSYII